MDVWIYRDAHGSILKTQPFAFASVSAPGRERLELQQGVHIQLPRTWDWVEQRGDRWFAGRRGEVYDVTEVQAAVVAAAAAQHTAK